MLLTSLGMFLILGLLAVTAFFAGKEHLDAIEQDEDILGHPLPRVHLHSR
jgi:hypothetical protein